VRWIDKTTATLFSKQHNKHSVYNSVFRRSGKLSSLLHAVFCIYCLLLHIDTDTVGITHVKKVTFILTEY